jgi:hypothetical protein
VYAPYIILFLLVLLIFLIISEYKFDQVFDVMLQSISSHRREAASPPSPPQLHAKNAVTRRNLQLQIPSKLIFKRAGYTPRRDLQGPGWACSGGISVRRLSSRSILGTLSACDGIRLVGWKAWICRWSVRSRTPPLHTQLPRRMPGKLRSVSVTTVASSYGEGVKWVSVASR